MKPVCILLLGLLFMGSGCSMIRRSPKTAFKDGYYVQKINKEKQQVYIEIQDDVLHIHQVELQQGQISIDTAKAQKIYETKTGGSIKDVVKFYQSGLDLDFLTIPLKYRPSKQGVPGQLNSHLNGAVYIGYRSDTYSVSYTPNPLRASDRTINHYGISFGLLTGMGNTAMTPTNTNNYIATEYDGILWTKGVAGIVAVNNFTVGFALGIDHLLDTNRSHWIYQKKPWLGLVFGLNLN